MRMTYSMTLTDFFSTSLYFTQFNISQSPIQRQSACEFLPCIISQLGKPQPSIAPQRSFPHGGSEPVSLGPLGIRARKNTTRAAWSEVLSRSKTCKKGGCHWSPYGDPSRILYIYTYIWLYVYIYIYILDIIVQQTSVSAQYSIK